MSRPGPRQPITEAEPSEVESFAQSLKMSYLMCRELGHNWRPATARYVRSQKVYERSLRCVRCTCERQQVLDASGSIISTHYVHPEGYLHKGLGRIVGEGRDVLRLESLNRFISSASSKAS